MQKSHVVLKKAVERVGAKAVARRLKVSATLVYKWCQRKENADDWRTASGAVNPLDRLQAIYEVTRDRGVINWLCQVADGYFVPNPEKGKGKVDSNVAKNIHHIIREFSETLDAISRSYADRDIDDKEAAKIRKEWEELKATGEGFVRACELGRYTKPGKERSGT